MALDNSSSSSSAKDGPRPNSVAPADTHILDGLVTGLALLNTEGYCEYANPALLHLLGCSADDLSAIRFHDLVHVDERACAICGADDCRLLDALRHPEDGQEFELVFCRRNHGPIIAACRVRQVMHGASAAIVLEVHDVTGERRVDLDALTRGPNYQFVANAAQIGSWSRDLGTDVVILCKVMSELLELPPDHNVLSDTQWRRMVHEDDLEDVERRIAEYIATGETFEIEYRVRVPSGRVIWLASRGTVVKDASGAPVSVSGMSIDITARKEADQQIKSSEERFRLLAEMSPAGIIVIVDGRIAYANHAVADLAGARDVDAVIGRAPVELLDPEYHSWIDERLNEVLETGRTPLLELRLHRVDGSVIWVQSTSGMVTWEGKPAIQVVVRDVTEEKETREQLRLVNERINLALASAGEAVWDWDLRDDTYSFSGGLKNLFEWTSELDTRGTVDWQAQVHPDDLATVQETIQACIDDKIPTYQCEFRLRSHGLSWRWVLTRGVVARRDSEGRAQLLTGTMSDITARKEADDLTWRHANLDSLTGLPNRRLYQERLALELDKAERSGHPFALLFLDLDRFKQVNDWLGHAAGDQLLIEAAQRIQHCVRKTDTVARLGGDEFTVLLVDLEGPGHVEFVCQKILEVLSAPFGIGGETAYISCSIGVALYPLDAGTPQELMRKADQAMYSAKENGKQQFRYFTKAMDDTAHRRLKITNELRDAIPRGQLSVHYQPVVRLSDGHIVKAEALARWHHPWLGNVEPSEFIPLAEEAGLIGVIGDWVLEQAVVQSGRWNSGPGVKVQIGVNQSALQFAMRNAKSERIHALVEGGLAGNNISIEITEGTLLDASPHVKEKLLLYRDAGIQVAIDDFGTGYSSLAYLQQFDIDYLKIDQSFIRDIDSNQANRTIVETIIMMAHKLGLQVIAEGIETAEQMCCLTNAGCDFGQGFLFSPAVPAGDFERFLDQGEIRSGMPVH